MSIKIIANDFRLLTVFITLTLLFSSIGITPAHAASVYFATPGSIIGHRACTSWADACTLQMALSKAVSGDEIWVKAGTHTPGSERASTFQLKSGVAIYGGFDGTETWLQQRSPSTHVTILSGDIGTVGVTTDNTYHVVTGATGAYLDGVTITGGNADGAISPQNSGGGMLNSSSSPTLYNVTFSGNSGVYGGGMCNFINSSPMLTFVTFTGNSGNFGGGMYNYTDSSPTLGNTIFSGNTATISGGGMYNYSSSNPTLTNVTFSGNSSAETGGGISNVTSNPTLTNVTFSGNSAETNGGGIYNYYNSSTMANVTFSGNWAIGDGGGMYNGMQCEPVLTNATFSGNSAGEGGGMYNYSQSSPQIRDTIFWHNLAGAGAQIYNASGGASVVNDSVVEGACPAGSSCLNIITTDPLLGTLGSYGGFTQTIPLQSGSSAINTGNNSTCATTDQRGITRPQGMRCDIGSYEVDVVPSVVSVTRVDANPTYAAVVYFTVSFSEAVTGTDAADFTLTKTGSISGASVTGVTGGPTAYNVAVNTGTGSGTVRLDLNASATGIQDLAGTPITGGFTGGQVYTVRDSIKVGLPWLLLLLEN